MIGILCATRGRPQKFQRMTDSIIQNGSRRYPMVAVIEADGTDYGACPEWDILFSDAGAAVPAMNIGAAHLLKTCPAVDWIVCINDDVLIQTPGWDVILSGRLPADQLAVAYPDDGFNHACTFPVISRRWVEILGYYFPPIFKSWYPDTWHGVIAARVRRLVYVPEVLFQHDHVFTGGAEMDATYAGGSANKERVSADTLQWHATAGRRVDDAAKIRSAINAAG